MAQEYSGILLLRINIDENMECFQKYKVNTVPCVKFYKQGEPRGEIIGARADEIRNAIEDNLVN